MEEDQDSYQNNIRCCVPGCGKITPKMHEFPKQQKRWQNWCKLIFRPDIIKNANPSQHRICSIHFEEETIACSNSREKEYAITPPTLYLPSFTNVSLRNTETQTEMHKKPDGSDEPIVINKSLKVYYMLKLKNNIQDIQQQESTSSSKFHTTFQRSNEDKGTQTDNTLNIDIDEEDISLSKHARLQTQIFEENETGEIFADKVDLSKQFASIFKRKYLKVKGILKEKYKKYVFFKKFRLFCLNLYYGAPKAYKLFEEYLSLPSEQTLFDTKLNLPSGVNEIFLNLVAKQLARMPRNAKYVTLCLDEIPLREQLYYDIRNDEFIGYHDIDHVKSSQKAKTAIILRIKGCFHIYEQAVGYIFCGGIFDYGQLNNWIDATIKLLFKYGFVVCTIGSIQSPITTQLAMVKGISLEQPSFLVDGKNIFFMFDIPHLLNSVRNELLTCFLLYDTYKIASWKHVKAFHQNQSLRKLKLAPKLTTAHIEPGTLECKSLKLMKDVFSYTVAKGIMADIESELQPVEASDTADFILKMNDLYDVFSLAKAKNNHQKPRIGVEYQKKCLSNAYTTFASIKAINSVTGIEKSAVGCFQGLVLTIQAFLQLQSYFRVLGINNVYTKRFHQNSRKLLIELTGLQTPASKSKMLTPIQFKRGFCKLALRNLLNTSKRFIDLDLIFKTGENELSCLEEYFPRAPKSTLLSIETTDYRIVRSLENAYTYFWSRCTAVHQCAHLMDYEKAEEIDVKPEINEGVIHSDAMLVPHLPKKFVEYLDQCQKVFSKEFDSVSLHKNVGSNLIKIIQESVTPISLCQCFPVVYLNKLFIRWSIYHTLVQFKPKVETFECYKLENL